MDRAPDGRHAPRPRSTTSARPTRCIARRDAARRLRRRRHASPRRRRLRRPRRRGPPIRLRLLWRRECRCCSKPDDHRPPAAARRSSSGRCSLRAWTMDARNGSPHVGVAPLLTVAQPGRRPGRRDAQRSSAACCRAADRLDAIPPSSAASTSAAPRAARARSTTAASSTCSATTSDVDAFDPTSDHLAAAERCRRACEALRADAALRARLLRLRPRRQVRGAAASAACRSTAAPSCTTQGPSTTTSGGTTRSSTGSSTDHVMVRFRHESSYDTRFGALDRLDG